MDVSPNRDTPSHHWFQYASILNWSNSGWFGYGLKLSNCSSPLPAAEVERPGAACSAEFPSIHALREEPSCPSRAAQRPAEHRKRRRPGNDRKHLAGLAGQGRHWCPLWFFNNIQHSYGKWTICRWFMLMYLSKMVNNNNHQRVRMPERSVLLPPHSELMGCSCCSGGCFLSGVLAFCHASTLSTMPAPPLSTSANSCSWLCQHPQHISQKLLMATPAPSAHQPKAAHGYASTPPSAHQPKAAHGYASTAPSGWSCQI